MFRHAAQTDRVRRYSTPSQLRRIDQTTAENVRRYSALSLAMIEDRIEALRREWSIERYLQLNIAAVGLGTALLAVTKDRRWGYATCAALGFFLLHSVDGFIPPLLVLRQFGIRTRSEIDREIYALKLARGDFEDVDPAARSAEVAERAAIAVGL